VVVPAALTATAEIAPTSRAAAVLATGTGDVLLRTTDGGRSFTAVTPPAAHGRWALVRFSTSHAGGALLVTTATATATATSGSAPMIQFWRSADGGAKWTGPVRVGS
jgi:hypothetical protein